MDNEQLPVWPEAIFWLTSESRAEHEVTQ